MTEYEKTLSDWPEAPKMELIAETDAGSPVLTVISASLVIAALVLALASALR